MYNLLSSVAPWNVYSGYVLPWGLEGALVHAYLEVMGLSDILQQGMTCLRTDGAQNCTEYLFPNSSFSANAQAPMEHFSLPRIVSLFLASRNKKT